MLASSLLALLPFLAIANATPVTKRGIKQLIQTGTPGTCLSIQGGRDAVTRGDVRDGTAVVVQSCSTAAAWDISPGSGSVLLSGTNFALDLGLNPTNNGAVYVWTSYPTSKPQTWYLTGDNRIAQTGGNQCLDLGPNGPQTYECTTGNTNQVWNVRNGDFTGDYGSPTTTTSAGSSTPTPGSGDAYSDFPVSTVYPNGVNGGLRIHPGNREDLCLTVNGGYAALGTTVSIISCFAEAANPDPQFPGNVQFQLWESINSQGQIKLHNYDYCLDAGSNPQNGEQMKIWSCGDYPQQKFNKNGNQFQTANNQCLNVQKESGTGIGASSKPYPPGKTVQTWECSNNGDPYMQFSGI